MWAMFSMMNMFFYQVSSLLIVSFVNKKGSIPSLFRAR